MSTSTTRVTIDRDDSHSLPVGRVNHEVLARTTEADVARQQRQDDAGATRARGPAGAAKALLKLLGKASEVPLGVLT